MKRLRPIIAMISISCVTLIQGCGTQSVALNNSHLKHDNKEEQSSFIQKVHNFYTKFTTIKYVELLQRTFELGEEGILKYLEFAPLLKKSMDQLTQSEVAWYNSIENQRSVMNYIWHLNINGLHPAQAEIMLEKSIPSYEELMELNYELKALEARAEILQPNKDYVVIGQGLPMMRGLLNHWIKIRAPR